MTSSACNTLVFTTRRRDPELISPSRPTPREYKYLSDIDERFCYHVPVIQFYRNNENDGNTAIARRKPDAVDVIRKAIADALVFYYPFAGRVRETHYGGKLVVECTGEGVMFIEADADIRLNQFISMTELKPPFPCSNELLCIVPGSGDVINCPLLLIQVTRFACGGFTIAHLVNHTISDAHGLHQFMIAVSEISRGYGSPSVLPVWGRALLNSDEPQPIPNREYDFVRRTEIVSLPLSQSQSQRVQHTFFFGQQEMVSLKKHMPPHLRTCSNFEILTACLWRCRTIAFNLDPKENVRLFYTVNGRGKDRLNLPAGFYGNAIGYGMVCSTAEKLCKNPLGYALDLVRNSKNKLLSTKTIGDRETTMKRKFFRSWTDCMTNYALPGSHYFVTDMIRARFSDVDYGWGKAVYGGSMVGGPTVEYDLQNPEERSLYIPFENNKGEYGILVPICFSQEHMDKFLVEVARIVSEPPVNQSLTSKNPIRCAL